MLIKWQTFAQISHLQIEKPHVRVKFAPLLNLGPCRSYRSEPVASGAQQTIPSVSSLDVL